MCVCVCVHVSGKSGYSLCEEFPEPYADELFEEGRSADVKVPVDPVLIKVEAMSASWSNSEEKYTLQNIDFEVNQVF